MKRASRGNLWAVVLAGGEGTRLAPLVRRLYGWDMPKQFAALDGDKSLLARTMDRIAPLVPTERTVVVITEAHERLAREQLAPYPGVTLIKQPYNLGTGPGILAPLAHVLGRDPGGRVAIFPSDHSIRRPLAFHDAVERAEVAARHAPSGVALVGAIPDKPTFDLGWIIPGAALAGGSGWQVHRFVEKPAEGLALYLLSLKGMWNTMVCTGGAAALWRLAERHLPQQCRELAPYIPHAGKARSDTFLVKAFASLLPADFSREVLEPARGLGLVSMLDSGWADCGTPERLLACLEVGPGVQSRHVVRVRQQARIIARAGRVAVRVLSPAA